MIPMKKHLLKIGVFSNDRVNVNAQRMVLRREGLQDLIKKRTAFLPEVVSLKQRLTTIFEGYKKIPKCPYCRNDRTFDNRGAYAYNRTCGSPSCASASRASTLGTEALAICIEKRKISMSAIGEDGLTSFQRMYAKQHQTKVTNGLYASYKDHSAKQAYRSKCMKITKMNDLSKLPNFHLRGSRFEGSYELDHKVSIAYGFTNGVDPKIIGHLCNLEMVPWRANARKNLKCSIPLEVLLEKISKHQ